MENQKEYLNEENYQKSTKKVNKVGTALLVIGLVIIIAAIMVAIYIFTSNDIGSHFLLFIWGTLPLLFIGFTLLGIGGLTKFTGHARDINAYMFQQQMPIAKETIEKAAPFAGVIAKEMAPSAGVVAKEIAKGIKEGLKDEE